MKAIFFPALTFLSLSSYAKGSCSPVQQTLGEKDFLVELTSYRHSTSQKHILILPPTGGSNFLDRSWARNFCAEGFNAHIIERWSQQDEYSTDLGLHQRLYGRSQKAIKIVLDQLSGAEYVGMLGTSIGGIFTAMAMGIQEKVNAAFVITAGADMAAMIANSDQEAMVDLWEKRRVLMKFPDKKAYIEGLRPEIEYDPLKLPRMFAGKDLGMVIATEDTTVPTDNQLKLKALWTPQSVIELPNNHFWAIVKSWLWDSGKVVRFFKESAQKRAL